MKTYNLEVYNHAGTVLARAKIPANCTEEAHKEMAKTAIGRGLQNFSVRDVSDDVAASWPEPEEKTAEEQKTDQLEQTLIDKTVAEVVEYFGAKSISAVENEAHETILSLLGADGALIISGTLEDLHQKAVNQWKPEPTDEEKFNAWFAELTDLATKADFPLADQESFRESFEEGFTPAETLEAEIDAGKDGTDPAKENSTADAADAAGASGGDGTEQAAA